MPRSDLAEPSFLRSLANINKFRSARLFVFSRSLENKKTGKNFQNFQPLLFYSKIFGSTKTINSFVTDPATL